MAVLLLSVPPDVKRYVEVWFLVSELSLDEPLQEFASLPTMAMNTRRITMSFLHDLGHFRNNTADIEVVAALSQIKSKRITLFLFVVSKEWADWFSFHGCGR